MWASLFSYAKTKFLASQILWFTCTLHSEFGKPYVYEWSVFATLEWLINFFITEHKYLDKSNL